MRTPLVAGAALLGLLVPIVASSADPAVTAGSETQTELQQFEALGPIAPAQVIIDEAPQSEGNSSIPANGPAIAAVQTAAGANSAIVTALTAKELSYRQVVALEVTGSTVVVHVQSAAPTDSQMTQLVCNDPLAEAALAAGTTEALSNYLAETPQGPCAQLVLSALALSGVEPAAGPTVASPPDVGAPRPGGPGGEFHEPLPPPFIPASEPEPEFPGIPDPGATDSPPSDSPPDDGPPDDSPPADTSNDGTIDFGDGGLLPDLPDVIR